jgi:septal ring factor EnvC (AmiA/AmiB activator)
MSSYQKALAVLVVAVMGIWGCAQGPAGGASAEKVRNLESKVNRLEEDFRASTTARDQFRKKLAETEVAVAEVRQERDEFAAQLRARTSERDTMAVQFESFRKNLKELLGQTEAALAQPGVVPATTASKTKAPNL